MDFIKKMAEEKLMGGNDNQQESYGQQNEGYSQQNEGYGRQQSNYGQEEQYGQQGGYNSQQQGGYGGNQEGNYGGQQNYGNEGSYGQTGGAQYNAPHGQGGASYGGGGGLPNLDQSAALQAANAHAGNGDDNSSFISSAMSRLSNMNSDDTDVDEDAVQQEHDQAYGQGNASSLGAGAMGGAAAMQALKMFTSGQSGASSGGGNMQSQIIGMAMSEAAKLFDQSGGAAGGTKQDAVNSAGQTIMKMMLKSQVSGMMGGGNSGGLSSLMGMASKFM